MEIQVLTGNISTLSVGAALAELYEGQDPLEGVLVAWDQALGGAISRLRAKGEIKGKPRELTLIHTLGRLRPERVLLVGLGKREELTPNRIRDAAAEALRYARRLESETVATTILGAGVAGIKHEQAAQALAEGAILGLYTFRRHQARGENSQDLEKLTLVDPRRKNRAELGQGVTTGRILAEAANQARDMVNEPANYMTPTILAQEAQKVAQAYGLECQILNREQMEAVGMGALLGVAQGSRQPPQFIILRYRGDHKSSRLLALVGKGITFDSGGISIKPADGMGEMKGDMAGGAAVISAMGAIAQLKPELNITGLVPATENLPGGNAYKPGDVLKSMSGKTIEVISTDAEGRLILADALCYAHMKEKATLVVDAATLTGACQVALGNICSGAFTNNQSLVDKVLRAGQETGERAWQLPMFTEYKEQNKSDVADIKNTGGRYAGAITAAQFLAEFAQDTPWVHLDIAGTARAEKDSGATVKGATGVPVLTFVNLALALAQEEEEA
ncbi:MAG: leucyl aminopeptidase [Chloroflexi bacterium]|nr:leucyl aminopeptidase [Chloroflexota bacterium]